MKKPYIKATCFIKKQNKMCYFIFINLEILLQCRSVKPEKEDIETN